MAKPPIDSNKCISTIKFLCGYGGKIVPRHPDGKLRYHGGHTRVLAVDRSVSFSELLMKMVDLCGTCVVLRCQLPTDDLDALVSIKSDEDLANLIEEYDLLGSSSSMKIKAFLWPIKSRKPPSPPPSETYATSPPGISPRSRSSSPSFTSTLSSPRYVSMPMAVTTYQIGYGKASNIVEKYGLAQNQYGYHKLHNSTRVHLTHSGNHMQ